MEWSRPATNILKKWIVLGLYVLLPCPFHQRNGLFNYLQLFAIFLPCELQLYQGYLFSCPSVIIGFSQRLSFLQFSAIFCLPVVPSVFPIRMDSKMLTITTANFFHFFCQLPFVHHRCGSYYWGQMYETSLCLILQLCHGHYMYVILCTYCTDCYLHKLCLARKA